MRYHLDTSFLVDWQRQDPRVERLVEEITAGTHTISIDAIVHTEFLAAPLLTRRMRVVRSMILRLARVLPITFEVSQRAVQWLAPMDHVQRRAHFADALIAAVASTEGATLITGDTTSATVFPVAVHTY
jgi:predicted nucleic acid-binding protein